MTISITDIDDALRAEDIEGLIELGAPVDEYASEAEQIASALQLLPADQLTEENLVAVIARIWTELFERSEKEIEERMTAFHRVANDILK